MDAPQIGDQGMIQTGIRCGVCDEAIYSNSRHDFVSCKCGETYVDGGFDYLRYGGTPAEATVTREVDRAALPRHFRDEKHKRVKKA